MCACVKAVGVGVLYVSWLPASIEKWHFHSLKDCAILRGDLWPGLACAHACAGGLSWWKL